MIIGVFFLWGRGIQDIMEELYRLITCKIIAYDAQQLLKSLIAGHVSVFVSFLAFTTFIRLNL